MKSSTFGTALVILGIMMIAYTGINFVTTKKVVDIGPINIESKENHPIQWPPAVGVVLIIGGIVVIFRGRKGIVN